MSGLRRTFLTLLPKLALSRVTGWLTRIPLPRSLRGAVYRTYARRYGVDLTEVPGELADYRSLQQFFARPCKAGTRPLAKGPIVWPCDGRIVSAGPLEGGTHLVQVKGRDYALDDFVVDPQLAAELRGGSQATVYLSPRDYHRVHAPFDAELISEAHVPGSLFPVNPAAVRAVFPLFVRNERRVFGFRFADGRSGAVVMVAALNVGDIRATLTPPARVTRGHELGRFGFGSTTVVIVGPGGPTIAGVEPGTPVRMGGAVPLVAPR